MKPIFLFLAFLFVIGGQKILASESEIIWEGKSQEKGFSAEIKVSKAKLSLDENLEITLTLSYPNTYSPDIDTIRMNLLKYVGLGEPPFILEKEDQEIIENKQIFHFTLDPQLPGSHFISLYQIPFLPKNSEKDKTVQIISTIFQIEVATPQEKENITAFIYPLLSLTQQFPITLNKENSEWIKGKIGNKEEKAYIIASLDKKALPWAQTAGLLLFVCAVLIARIQPKTLPDKKKERSHRIQTAKRKALWALEKLKSQIPAGKSREVYTGLAQTTKNYMEESFQVNASKQTTEEFLHKLSSLPALDTALEAGLIDLMQTSDRVKFASHTPSEEELDEAQKVTKLFIEKTG